MALAAVTLDDKYEREQGLIYLTGSQALVRMAMMQSARDKAAGLNTGCFISGYRGSPMHNADKELWRAGKLLDRSRIHFVPAVNEDIAATSCWGAQQVNLFQGAKVDGVFALWYGKGPGLDRSVDAIRHANLAGTSRHGGVLAVVGDDHGMKSSDVVAVSEPTFIDLMMPVLFPGSVQELIEYGLYGWALSRFSGAWVGFKTVAATLDTVASVSVDPRLPEIIIPEFRFPSEGVHIRVPDPWSNQEPRLTRFKIPAALAFAQANRLNRLLVEPGKPRFGIISTGTTAYDVLEALASLGIDRNAAASLGLAVLKIGMPYPLDTEAIRSFAAGVEEILVVEEKRRIIETGVKDALYALPEGRRPRVVGRFDEAGEVLLTELGDLGPDAIARAIATRIAPFHASERIKARLAFLDAKARERTRRERLAVVRTPFFCSGCPHNTSTRPPEGSRAHGGVGCHYMSTNMERGVVTHTHMGGEGATWIGQSPFVETPHVFQNLGDGTYFHSGLLAVRACVAAKVNITYKILFNDAVAMTGGQPIDGELSPQAIAQQVAAEGVRRIVVVSEEPERYTVRMGFPPGTTIEPRSRLDAVQRELREVPGVSVLIYDQTCAAEKRRRRKKGDLPDPGTRMFINERVCEGCGDCSVKSNCLSVVPVETEYGRKRRIDQSSCNKDYSCREGFCPSFVSVVGGRPRRSSARSEVPVHLKLLPEPARAAIPEGSTYNILVTGIGGTGVVTIGAMITMAAHLEGRACSAVDQFGMAQKGGAVTSHIRIAAQPGDIGAVLLNSGSADLILGCDNLVAAGDLALETVSKDRTRLIVNTHETITGQFTRNPDLEFPTEGVVRRLEASAGPGRLELVDATRIATRLMGDSIATNMFMLGYACQKSLVPVTSEAIERAIELNGVAITSNLETFRWGRRAAVDWVAVEAIVSGPERLAVNSPALSLDDLVRKRSEELVQYQNAGYAARYQALVDVARNAERAVVPGSMAFAEAVARYAYKLMAYKDEYEVARLYSAPEFDRQLREAFEGDYRLQIHLAPPLLARRHPDTGLPIKTAFGPWMRRVMRVLARLKGLRGTAFDPFGRSEERRTERGLITEYEARIAALSRGLTSANHALAIAIASAPERIRGYGHVKARHLAESRAEEQRLLAEWAHPQERRKAAE